MNVATHVVGIVPSFVQVIRPPDDAEPNTNGADAAKVSPPAAAGSDVFAADVRKATVVTLYMLPPIVQGLRPVLLRQLRPGSRIVLTEVEGRLEISPATTPVRLEEREGALVAVADADLPVLTAEQVRDAIEATRR